MSENNDLSGVVIYVKIMKLRMEYIKENKHEPNLVFLSEKCNSILSNLFTSRGKKQPTRIRRMRICVSNRIPDDKIIIGYTNHQELIY